MIERKISNKPGPQTGSQSREEKELEDCYYVRDLIKYNNKTNELWKLIISMLNTETVFAMYKMSIGKKRVPVYNEHGKVVSEKEVMMKESDFHEICGFIRGLKWLDEKINAMMNKAKRADEREARKEMNK
jgi:mevalonate kinase